jgi:hypothetical protein
MTYFYIKLEVLTMPCEASSFPRSAGLQTDFEQFASPEPGFEYNPSIHPLLRRDIRKKGTLNRDELMQLCTGNLGLLFGRHAEYVLYKVLHVSHRTRYPHL